MDKESIFQSHIEDILKIVSQNPNCRKEEVYSQLEGSKGTKVKRVNQLIEDGYINETKHLGTHNIKTLILTDKGERTLTAINIINGDDVGNFRTPSESIQTRMRG